ncbi:MAG: DMT family transporter [Rhodobacteraceae bacterium]|nr:DMT family transporter [Paracoccaceae bacterium]
MVAAMAGFAVEDALIKQASAGLPVGEIMAVFGFGGWLGFLLLTWHRGQRALTPDILRPTLLMRAATEIFGRLFFTLSLAYSTLAATSSILQATPLAVTLGAALFFGEKVGARRWATILVGFFGVLLILRPLPSSFDPTSLLALLGMLGFAGRDLATRAAPPRLSHLQLGVYGFVVLIPTGLALMLWEGGAVLPSPAQTGWLMATILVGIGAYYALTSAMRLGAVSMVAPFRYSRLLFALILAVVLFGERPDMLTLVGAAVIVLSGLILLRDGRRSAPA